VNVTTFLVVMIGWIFSLCLHEFSHALVAYHGGDTTVKDKGYLTFNPLKYTHPFFSLILPLIFLMMGGIGLPGGAVYIERWRLRGPLWETAVSLAGPFSNAVLAFLLGILLQVGPVTNSGIWPGIAFLAFVQISAVVLNLIPLPPFDGFGAIEPFLPMFIRERLAEMRGMLSWVVLFLFIGVPSFARWFWGTVSLLAQIAGIPLELTMQGLDEFRFWQ
jgi:Zn-dependent protease